MIATRLKCSLQEDRTTVKERLENMQKCRNDYNKCKYCQVNMWPDGRRGKAREANVHPEAASQIGRRRDWSLWQRRRAAQDTRANSRGNDSKIPSSMAGY